MQLGIRLHDIKKAPLEERLAIAHEQGFACGHLALAKVISEYPVDDGALTPGYAMYLKKIFAENQLDVAVLLGAGVVGTETGAVNEEYRFEERNHSEEALKIFINNLCPVVSYAEKMGVIVAIEPVYKHIVCNPKRARKVLDAIGSPNLQIIFDPVNLLDICNYKDRDAIIAEAIDVLGEDIAMVHIKDFKMENNSLVSVAAGTGEMNYDRIIRFMKERKPYIHATLENTVPENAVASREYIQRLWEECHVG